MKNKKTILASFLLVILLLLPVRVWANAAPPSPSLTIFVIGLNNPDKTDLTLVLPEDYQDEDQSQGQRKEDQEPAQIEGIREIRGWETSYEFPFIQDVEEDYLSESRFVFSQGEEILYEFSYPQVRELERYDKWYFNYETKNLEVEETSTIQTYQTVLTLARVGISILIEALIFFAFGFRAARSWLVFLIINLITQGFLGYISAGSRGINAFGFILLLVLEIFIFVLEAVVINKFVHEYDKKRKVSFALLANIVSFIVGTYIVANLPM